MTLLAREAITPTNQSPIFLIVTWILEAAVLLAVVVKVLLSYTSTGVHTDDWCILVTAALSIAQVVATSFQGISGIGKVQTSLSQHDLDIYQKAGYAAEMVYILTLVTSKLSIALFLYHLTPFEHWRRIVILVGVFTIAWGFSSIFVVAFQCEAPYRWAIIDGQCINQVAFWTTNSIIHIMIQLALICVPFAMIYTTISSVYKRTVLMFCFSPGLSVVAIAALQIYYLHHRVYPSAYSTTFNSENDYTFSTWPVLLTTQIVQSLSIITTCIPFMRNLFLGLETGMIQTGHIARRKVSTAVTHRWNERSNLGSSYSSGLRSNNDTAALNLQLSTWHFTNDEAGYSMLNQSNPAENRPIAHQSSRRYPNASSSPENDNTTYRIRSGRNSRSSSNASRSRNSTSPASQRHGSQDSQRSAIERSYSRRQVSMIVEDDEDVLRQAEGHIAVSETRTMLGEGMELPQPEPAFDMRTSTRNLVSS